MGKQGWLPVIESCHRITIRDVSANGKKREGYEWGNRFVWPSGFAVDAECRLDSHEPNLRKVRIKYQTGEYQDEERANEPDKASCDLLPCVNGQANN